MTTASNEQTNRKGLLIVITGNGKGKTTSALGQAIRAVGNGQKVFIMQFMKDGNTGEINAIHRFLPMITIRQCGNGRFISDNNIINEDIIMARQGLSIAEDAVNSNEYDLIILDEINVAIYYRLLAQDDIIDLIQRRNKSTTLVLTGRYAKDAIINIADTVSDIKEVKHHYSQGIDSQAGIEY